MSDPQQERQQKKEQQQEQEVGQRKFQDQGSQRGGTMNSPGDANESGSAGSTRRDDTTTPGSKR